MDNKDRLQAGMLAVAGVSGNLVEDTEIERLAGYTMQLLDELSILDGDVVMVPVVNCPNCGDQGWYMVADTHTGEPMQEQCQFCDTVPNSRFNVERIAMIAAQEKG